MAVTINGDGLIQVDGTTSTQGRVRLAEDADNGSNYVELTAPASVAANRTITFPDATTTVVGTDATQTLTNKTLTAPTITGTIAGTPTITSPTLTSPTIGGTPVVNGSLIVAETAVPTSGATTTISGIPSWAKRVTLLLDQVSTNGTSPIFIRLGTSGGIDSGTGYTYTNHIIATGVDRVSNLSAANYDTGFCLTLGTSYTTNASLFTGQYVFSLFNSNLWVIAGQINNPISGGAWTLFTTGRKSLGAALTQIQLYTFNGTDVFDGGNINILYE